jgi:site-specific DNA-methyltransferase (adenine-specific)
MPVDLTEDCLPGFFQAAPPRDRDHITQKPVSVCRDLVKIAPPGGTVLDPFMGAGTVGVAAVIEARRFIGCEITEHFQGVALDRIARAQLAEVPRPGLQGVLDFT